MKKIFFSFLMFLLICTTAFGASFQMEDNPNYKHPIITSSTSSYSNPSLSPVTFNNRSAGNDNFHGGFDTTKAPNYNLSWVPGPSGASDDYAFAFTAKDGAASTNGDGNYAYMFYYTGTNFKSNGGSMFLEFDIKLNTTTDRFKIWSLPLWDGDGLGRIIFDETGKVYGTDVSYEANKWMNVKIQVNFETNKCNMWLDDALVKSNVVTGAATWGEGTRLCFFMHQVTAKSSGEPYAGYAIDNIYAYFVGENISNYVTMNVTTSDGLSASASNAPVNPKIKLSFPADFNLSLLNNENIKLQNSANNIIEGSIEVDSATFSVVFTPLRKLSYEENYTIKLSDEIRKECKSSNPATGKLTFTTGNARDVVISDFSISSSAEGNLTKATATLTNNTVSSIYAGVMLAVYDKDGGLSAIKRVNINLAKGENNLGNELTIVLPDDFDFQSKVKLFVTLADNYSVIHEATLE